MTALTPRQKEILEAVVALRRANGYPPTVRQLAAAVGLRSPATVFGHLRALEQKGYLRRDALRKTPYRMLVVEDSVEAR